MFFTFLFSFGTIYWTICQFKWRWTGFYCYWCRSKRKFVVNNYSVAIGSAAGSVNQGSNCIAVNSSGTDRCHIAPIRRGTVLPLALSSLILLTYFYADHLLNQTQFQTVFVVVVDVVRVVGEVLFFDDGVYEVV